MGTCYIDAAAWRVGRSMDYIHYSIKEIFMSYGDDETEVELVIIRETRVGGLQ